ncbi:MAG: 2-amino-4-hydroxy-6-hydroxymethyldihydropteridine diphosphokinase [Mycobacterium kyogaense]|uniref:2-amino-4-hydroxy-6- hydroxymethyldihydropteridine diphosphokinase n=1 Tax=Mycobacterium kyogaense TaxID=2212479 RepID=UPI002FFBEE8D
MTSVVLSIGSNLGDRLAHLQSVLDGLGDAVTAVSPVYETAAWGGVEQGAFFNAVVLAEDASRGPHDWLHRAHELEDAARRVREQHWGPRTLDVDLVEVRDGGREIAVDDDELTLPHPYAHVRAFVLVPWLAVAPAATLTVEGRLTPVDELLAALDPAERDGVHHTEHALTVRTPR